MRATDRALCHATARWLAACARSGGALGLGAGFVAALGLMLPGAPAAGCALALLLVLPERLLALRLAFDAGLFADLADDAPSPSTLGGLDAALHTLGLRAAAAHTRGLDERVAGARRLSRQYIGVVLLQAAALALALGWQVAGRAA